jgi:hypothetical protein
MTIAITVERYYAVSSPYTYQIRLLKKGFWWILFSYVLPVIFTAIFLNIPKILQLGKVLSMLPDNYKQISIKTGIVYQVFHPLSTNCILPIAVLSVDVSLGHPLCQKPPRLLSGTSSVLLDSLDDFLQNPGV